MRKFLGLSILVLTSATLTACSMDIPTCNDELNNCDRGAAYTEERTVKASPKIVVAKPAPAPAPTTVIEPAPTPVLESVIDVKIMQSAEPKFTHVSK